MKRLLPFLLAFLPAAGQQPPSPVKEKTTFGSLDVGYRWGSTVSGDWATYRSVVNLQDGFRVRGVDFHSVDPARRLYDKLTFFADSWGDPYNSARVDIERSGGYRLWFNYRNIDYFNFLPSFANPAIEQGSLVNQRSFDIRRRFYEAELQLRPGKRLVPYLAFSRDSGSGRGITPFVTNGNEYPVATVLRDQTNNFRGGVNLEFGRWHLTLEQGGTAFKDDQTVFTTDRNLGNRRVPLLGQELFLSQVRQAYGARGESLYSRGVFTAAPVDAVHLYAQFQFSQPKTDIRYNDNGRGLFYLGATRFFNSLESLASGEAKQPHSSGMFSAEIRLHPKVRLFETVLTDRLHNASSLALVQQLFFAGSPAETVNLFTPDRLVMNYSRQQVDAFVDVTRKLTVRGGHRYEWGDAQLRSPTITLGAGPQSGELKRHVGLAGVNFRAAKKLSFNVDYERGDAEKTYFRTSLHDYHQLRSRATVQALASLQLLAHFSLLDNENPAPAIRYDFRNLAGGLSVRWTPKGGHRISFFGDYSRSRLRSDISFLALPFLERADSFYRDNAHAATGILDVNLPSSHKVVAPKISAGGTLFRSSGSRPTRYYQPFGRFLVPLHENVSAYAEWRWYGLTEPFYTFEGFRNHHVVFGLKFSL
jgi:hypothetical protein